jgi:hypothetical protein
MGWILEIAKMSVVCLFTILVLVVAYELAPHGNAKATGLALFLSIIGSRLAIVGVLNLVIGFVLTRLYVFGDAAGKLHVTLR